MELTDVAYDHADLEVSGSGNILLKGQASQTIDFDVSGSGDVYYAGNPVLDVQISGSGTVKKIWGF